MQSLKINVIIKSWDWCSFLACVITLKSATQYFLSVILEKLTALWVDETLFLLYYFFTD